MNEALRSGLLLVVILATGAGGPRPDQKFKEERVLRGHTKAVFSLAFSPDGKTLASSGADWTVRLWDVATGKERATLKGHRGWVNCVAFSPDGNTVASGGSDKTVRLWGTRGESRKVLRGQRGAIHTLAFSQDGKRLAVGGEGPPTRLGRLSLGDLSLWDVQAGRELLAPVGYTGTVGAVCFSPDGRMLAAGDAGASVTLWELAGGKVWASFEGHHGLVGSLAFAADGSVLASGSRDDTVRVWDLRTGKTLKTLAGHARHVYSIALNRKGKLLVSGSEDRTIMFWDPSSGKELATIYEDSPVWSVALTPDARLLAAGVGETIKIWDVDKVLKEGARQPRRPPPPAKDKGPRPK